MLDTHLPDLRILAPALAVLTAMITPAILVLAAGTLIGSTSARLARVVDRVRVLSDTFEALETGESKSASLEERRVHIFGQLGGLTQRARLLQLSMLSMYLALASFISTSAVLGLLAFVTPDRSYSPYVPVIVALSGMVFLFAGSMLLIFEARVAFFAVHDEMRFVTKLGRKFAPAEMVEGARHAEQVLKGKE
jgi:Protein of unknown function (DUF2721)